MTHRSSILVLGALLLVPAAARADKPGCHAIQTSSPQARGGKPDTRFSALGVNDLSIAVHFDASMKGEHSVEVRIFTPKGHLYQSLEAPFSADPMKPGTTRRLPNYPQPIAVLPASASSLPLKGLTKTVTLVFPVGGTNIVTSSLYGDWKFQAYLDGCGTPCGPAATVTITP